MRKDLRPVGEKMRLMAEYDWYWQADRHTVKLVNRYTEKQVKSVPGRQRNSKNAQEREKSLGVNKV